MFRLKALGTLALERESAPVPAAATQKRRLALLAIVASHGSIGIPREKAALLLWPESTSDSSRHSLSQLLYSIRQSLGVDPFSITSGVLRINDDVMTSDLKDLDAAIDAHDAVTVSRLYTGTFLEGFSLSDSIEFDHWMESERARRHAQVRRSLEQHAHQLTAEGRNSEAAEWWKKLAVLEPVDSRIAVSLMRSLDAAGNRPGALQHANIHSTLVREELGIDPDPVVAELERHLRTPVTGTHPVDAAIAAPLAAQTQAAPVTAEESRGPGVIPHARRGMSRRIIAGIAVLAGAAILVSAILFRREAVPASGSGTAVAVLPFAIHSDSSIDYLREGLVGLLSSDLDGAGDLRAVDPRALLKYSAANPDADDQAHAASVARHFNADLIVQGEAAQAGEKLRISAGLFDLRAPGSPISTATVEGDRTRLFELVDQLASTLLSGRYRLPGDRLIQSATVTTQSIPALKAYLAGEQDFRAGRYSRAVEAFDRATSLDSTFALAYYRMSVAAEWDSRPDLESRAASAALRFSTHLSDHDRNLVEAFAARRARNPDKAEMLYRRIVREFPDDVEAWFQLGEILFHDNALRGRSFTESREAWEHVLKIVPSDADAVVHLARVLARTGPPSALNSLVQASLRFLPQSQQLETEALRAFSIGSRNEQDSMLTRLRSDPEAAWQSLWRVAVYPRNVSGAERIADLLVQTSQPNASRAIGHTASMLLLIAQGKVEKARPEGLAVPRGYPWSREIGYIYFPLLGFARTDSVSLRKLRSEFDAWNPAPMDASQIAANPPAVLSAQYKAYIAGLLSVMLGEASAAMKYSQQLRQTRAPEAAQEIPAFLATIVQAAALRQQGKSHEALSLLERWHGAVPITISGALGAESYYGWLRAELLNDVGRNAEALKWYETRADLFPAELIYVAPAAFRSAQIYEKLGDRARAAAAYRVFIDMWKDADPELQSYVSVAREQARVAASGSISQGKR
jgi:DNA-binding SARP family transcriptional activator/TolB-like protein